MVYEQHLGFSLEEINENIKNKRLALNPAFEWRSEYIPLIVLFTGLAISPIIIKQLKKRKRKNE